MTIEYDIKNFSKNKGLNYARELVKKVTECTNIPFDGGYKNLSQIVDILQINLNPTVYANTSVIINNRQSSVLQFTGKKSTKNTPVRLSIICDEGLNPVNCLAFSI